MTHGKRIEPRQLNKRAPGCQAAFATLPRLALARRLRPGISGLGPLHPFHDPSTRRPGSVGFGNRTGAWSLEHEDGVGSPELEVRGSGDDFRRSAETGQTACGVGFFGL